MADKQIKDFANTPLADTDSLVKQSVAGLTGKATLTDIKSNLDGRYKQRDVVVWENASGDTVAQIMQNINNRWVEIEYAPVQSVSTDPVHCRAVLQIPDDEIAHGYYMVVIYNDYISVEQPGVSSVILTIVPYGTHESDYTTIEVLGSGTIYKIRLLED